MSNDGGPPAEAMTLRDYFAAAALRGMFANSRFNYKRADNVPAWAYGWADAMLAEREKGGAE